MQSNLTREQALALLKTYNKEPFHIQHALTVEGVMRWYANELGYGADADYWATVGLLHDIDFENWPEAVSYTHLRAHETGRNLVCRLLLEKKKTGRKLV